MAINFPQNPVSGQVYDFGDYRYTFDGVKWTSVIRYGLAAAKIQSETPPPNPEAGLMWYQPSTGLSFIWYEDEDSGQWVEENPSIGAEILAASAVVLDDDEGTIQAYRNSKADREALAGRAVFESTADFATGISKDGTISDSALEALVGTETQCRTEGFYTGSTSGNATYKLLNEADSTAAGYVTGYSRFQIRSLDVYACLDFKSSIVCDKFGMIGDYDTNTESGTDNSVAYQHAVDFCDSTGSELIIGLGRYYTSSKIVIPQSFKLSGISRIDSRIITKENITVHEHTTRFDVRDITVEQRGAFAAQQNGIAFGTPRNNSSATQANYCNFERVTVLNFDFSWWFRTSIWCSWTNCISSSIVGIRFARVADPYDVTSNAPYDWNIFSPSLGWFHNQGYMDNCLFEDDEVGIWGCFMGYSIRSCTTQRQSGDKANNTILPVSEERTGVYVESGTNGIKSGWTNTIDGVHYAEACKKPFKIKDQSSFVISNAFVQGGSSSSKYPTPLEADNSNVIIDTMTGQDWYDWKAILVNNARVFGDTAGAVSGGVASVEAGSLFYRNGRVETYFNEYSFSIAAGGADTVDIPENMSDRSVYRVNVVGIRDGSQSRGGSWYIYHYQGGYTTIRSATETTDSQITVSVSGDTVSVNWGDSTAFQGRIIFERISDLTTQITSLTPY